MTEDEAKTKWCPFTRVGSTIDSGPQWGTTTPGLNRLVRASNGETVPLRGANCIGSGCMMWRGDHCGIAPPPDNIEIRGAVTHIERYPFGK